MDSSVTYWDDCVDPIDLDTMWMDLDVVKEWINAGETKGSKVHLSRDPDGQTYLTRTELKAVAKIIVSRHFSAHIESDMLCAIAELESNRQLLLTSYNKKTKDSAIGIMQLSLKTAEWLVKDLDYRTHKVTTESELYKPFINMYLGAAYLTWLSNFDQQERSEEFMVRAYKGGTKMGTHKSTLEYWKKYLSVKESLWSRNGFEARPSQLTRSLSVAVKSEKGGEDKTTWDSRTTVEEMEEMWKNPSVRRKWRKTGEKKGKVRFSYDDEKRLYLSRVELKAVADITIAKHFSMKGIQPAFLCALCEIINERCLNGLGLRTGLMGIDLPTARWLYKACGYKAFKVASVEDLLKPFVSMYFGAAYYSWLSKYDGIARSPQFIFQAYLSGPQNVKEGTEPIWLKFEEALSRYESLKLVPECCTIL